MTHRSSAVKRENEHPQLEIVVIGCGPLPVLFLDYPHVDILEVCFAVEAMGHAVWLTPSALYIFTGDAE